MMKIVIAHFQNITGISGGMEKVICDFSNAMAERGHEIHLLVYDEASGRPYYPLQDNVHVWNLRQWKSEPGHMPLLRKMEREFCRFRGGARAVSAWYDTYRAPYILPTAKKILREIRPDVVICHWHVSSYLVAQLHLTCPVVNVFHTRPAVLLKGMSKNQIHAIERSELIQVLTPNFKKELEKVFPYTRVVCIPNVVPQREEKAYLNDLKERYQIICVGRLNKETKRQHLLIEAFSRLATDFPNWDVKLWGMGGAEYINCLKHKITEYHLEKRVFLNGVTTNIYERLIKADIFAFPSEHEGWGLAMTEAMSVGLPVVAFESCSGVNELIRNGETGFLSEDGVSAFTEKLRILMRDQKLRIQIGEAAREEMKQYASKKIWDQWEQVLTTLVQK